MLPLNYSLPIALNEFAVYLLCDSVQHLLNALSMGLKECDMDGPGLF